MKCILISGFEPFDGAARNSSQDLVLALERRMLQYGTITLRSCVLPVVCDEAWFVLRKYIDMHNPLAVVAFGQSKRTGIHLEQCAYNRNVFRIPDNNGNQPCETEVIPGEVPVRSSTLPIERLASKHERREIPVVVSSDPGRFVCNNLFYHMQTHLKDIPSGFVHLPFSCSDKLVDETEQLLRHLSEDIRSAQLP